MVCEICGLGYDPTHPPDRSLHWARHDETVNGARAKPHHSEQGLWADGADRVCLVTDESPVIQRKRADRAASVANREMHHDQATYRYYDPPDDRRIRIYLFIRANRVVGFLAVERRGRQAWHCTWDESGVIHPELVSDFSPRWTVGFMWTLPKLRRQGIIDRLITLAARDLQMVASALGWYPPISDAGKTVVRKHCPHQFYAVR